MTQTAAAASDMLPPMSKQLVAGILAVGALLAGGVAPASAAAPRLSAERYAALEPVLKAAVTNESDEATAKDQKAFDRVCLALDRTDVLLRTYRETCIASTASDTAMDRASVKCLHGARCAKLAADAARELKALVKQVRALNTVMNREIADVGCRTAMRASSHDLKIMDAVADLTPALVRVLQERATVKEILALGGKLEKVDIDSLTSAKQQYAMFRKACK
jgi:hypothetical protein